MPAKPDEILVPEVFHPGVLNVGDTIYLTTFTPDRILNTLRYTIDSALNPNNLYDLQELGFLLRGNLALKEDFTETARGFLNLEGVYYPVTLQPKAEED